MDDQSDNQPTNQRDTIAPSTGMNCSMSLYYFYYFIILLKNKSLLYHTYRTIPVPYGTVSFVGHLRSVLPPDYSTVRQNLMD
jgi:hypothetical protein